MPKALSEIAGDAFELPVADRRRLARILLEATDADEDFSEETEQLWDQELARRLAAVKAGKADSRAVEDVFADLDRPSS